MEEALAAAVDGNDLSVMNRLLAALRSTYQRDETYASPTIDSRSQYSPKKIPLAIPATSPTRIWVESSGRLFTSSDLSCNQLEQVANSSV
jgi:hypothetical protein